jgi:putative DNA primase/helicase
MLGGSGVVRLVPDEEVETGLGISEGIENALTLMTYGWHPMWACGSAGGIAKFPVLAGIEALTIFADCDDKGAGIAATRECGDRWHAAGREVIAHYPPPGTDWNAAAQIASTA